jgi:hypothetical protein
MRESGRETDRRQAEAKAKAKAKAKARRESAARARRLAQSVTQDHDRAQLLDYAKTLDAEAEALERQASGPASTRKQEQPQQQAQQQAAAEPTAEPTPTTNGKPGNGKKPKG